MTDRAPLAVVIATRDRATSLMTTLDRLASLPERPEIIVVDNASRDGTPELVAGRHPGVRLLPQPVNRGALARNAGVRATAQRYVAFSDDDSWWEPGALAEAVRLMDADPRIGLIAARTVVAPGHTPDPLNDTLATSPLDGPAAPPTLPGPPVLGFLGCAAVARRAAFLSVGGFHRLLFFGAEEALLAYDLTAAGWLVCYAPQVTAVHQPAAGPRPGREVLIRRNETLTAWLRRPVPVAARRTWALARRSPLDGTSRRALCQVATRLPAALLSRRRLPERVERGVRLLEEARGAPGRAGEAHARA